MAHMSGYSGAITYAGAEGPTVWAPTTSEIALQSWTLHQETQTFECLAKGEAFFTKFATISRWTGTATYILQTALTTATDDFLTVREAAQALVKKADITLNTTDGLQWDGNAWVTRTEFDDPLDGPALVVIEFTGDGGLVSS